MSVIIEDQTEKLTLFHYQGVNESTEDNVKQNRGKITDETNEEVCNSFSYTPEYTIGEREKYVPLLEGKLDQCEFYRSEEGTLLRVFFHDHRWHLSTFKRIDAFQSRWSSIKTFGELFMEAVSYYFTYGAGKGKLDFEEEDLFDVLCNTFDRNLVYTFLLRTNKDTKIVCTPPEQPTVYFAGCFREGVRELTNATLLPSPQQLKFDSVEQLEAYVSEVNPFEHQGVIAMLPDQSTVKIIHPFSLSYKTIRGSDPDVEMAYFRNRKTEPELFSTLFPHVDAPSIEGNLLFMIKYIHRMYVRRFIKKLYTILHPALFHVLRKAHTWHIENRSTNIVTLDKITSIIESEPYLSVYRMYQEYKEQVKQSQRLDK